MTAFPESLRALGGFHDAKLVTVVWKGAEGVLKLELDDLNANFLGLPEYEGAQPGVVQLAGAQVVELQLNATQSKLRVYDWIAEGLPDGRMRSTITFSPEGRIVADHNDGLIKSTGSR